MINKMMFDGWPSGRKVPLYLVQSGHFGVIIFVRLLAEASSICMTDGRIKGL